jgi:hypothetical protein
MRLKIVLSSVNNNPNYYLFIPAQIKIWCMFNIKFIAIFVGEKLPDELLDYTDNIILYNKNTNISSMLLGQLLRLYYPALLNLEDDELVMITDMDMLPTNDKYYTKDLEDFDRNSFIYYRHIFGDQLAMCYNSAHPSVWSKLFNIKSIDDIEQNINIYSNIKYNNRPGKEGWFTDQILLYKTVINYPHLKILNRPLSRLEIPEFINLEENISNYDDFHCHRKYNKDLVDKLIIKLTENIFNKTI